MGRVCGESVTIVARSSAQTEELRCTRTWGAGRMCGERAIFWVLEDAAYWFARAGTVGWRVPNPASTRDGLLPGSWSW